MDLAVDFIVVIRPSRPKQGRFDQVFPVGVLFGKSVVFATSCFLLNCLPFKPSQAFLSDAKVGLSVDKKLPCV